MNNKLVVSIFIILLVGSIIPQSYALFSIPPTPAFQKITTSNSTVKAKNYTATVNFKAIGGKITGSDNGKTIIFNFTGTGGKNGTNGTNGTSGTVITPLTCPLDYQLHKVASTGVFTCAPNNSTGSSSATYDLMQNAGTSGAGFYKGNTTKTTFQFKNLTSNRQDLITVTKDASNVILDSTLKLPSINCGATNFLQILVNTTGFTCAPGSLGTITTATNLGTSGFGFFSGVSGSALQFFKLISANSNCILSTNSTNVILTCSVVDTNTAQISNADHAPQGLFGTRQNATQNTIKSIGNGNANVKVTSNSTHVFVYSNNTSQIVNAGTSNGLPLQISRDNATQNTLRSITCNGLTCSNNATNTRINDTVTSYPIIVPNSNNQTSVNNAQTLTLSNFVSIKLPNNILVVSVAYSQVPTGTTVTYNGLSLTKIGSVTGSAQHYVEMWYLKNAPTGTFNIVATQTSVASNMIIGAAQFYNVNQTSVIGTPVSHTDTNGNPHVSLTTTKNNSTIITSLVTGVANLPSIQSIYYQNQVPPLITSQGTYLYTNTTRAYNMTFTGTGGVGWGMMGVELLPIITNEQITCDNLGNNGIGPCFGSSGSINHFLKLLSANNNCSITGNSTNQILNCSTQTGTGVSINGLPASTNYNIVRGNANMTNIGNLTNTITIYEKSNHVLTNETNQTITKPLGIQQLTLRGTVEGKNNRMLDMGTINATRYSFVFQDTLITGINRGTLNPIISFTPMHGSQSMNLNVSPNSTSNNANVTSIQWTTTNNLGDYNSKYLLIGGSAGNPFTIYSLSGNTKTPNTLGIWIGINSTGYNIEKLQPDGSIQFNSTITTMNFTQVPGLKLIINEKTNVIKLKSALMVLAEYAFNCGIGCGPGTDWAVKAANIAQTTIGGINFACQNSTCTQGVFEINDGQGAGGVIRFGIFDNATLAITKGSWINLDCTPGNQAATIITCPSLNYITYQSINGTNFKSGNKVMEIINGSNNQANFTNTAQVNGISVSNTNKTSGYTLVIKDDIVNTYPSANPTIYILPTCVNAKGKEYELIKSDQTRNIAQIKTTSSQTIGKFTNYNLTENGDYVTVQCDGVNWDIINYLIKDVNSLYPASSSTAGAGENLYVSGALTGYSQAAIAPQATNIQTVPLIISTPVKIDTVNIDVTVGLAASSCDVALYRSNSTNYPTTQVTGSFKNIATATSSQAASATYSPALLLQPGLYWIANECSSAATLTIDGISTATAFPAVLGSNVGAFTNGNTPIGWTIANAFSAASFPNSYPLKALTFNTSPIEVLFRIVG